MMAIIMVLILHSSTTIMFIISTIIVGSILIVYFWYCEYYHCHCKLSFICMTNGIRHLNHQNQHDYYYVYHCCQFLIGVEISMITCTIIRMMDCCRGRTLNPEPCALNDVNPV